MTDHTDDVVSMMAHEIIQKAKVIND